jgi:DNA-directed RNA polymerase specialized sigma24 family protein
MLDEDRLLELYERAKYVACKRGHSELADDFAQEAVAGWLSGCGRHQTVEQRFIDYLRSQYGRAGLRSSRLKFQERRKYVDLDEARNIAADPGDVGAARQFAYLFAGRQAFLYDAYFVQQLSEKEIGEMLNVSESRVSQMLKPMKLAIQDEAVLQDGLDRMEWDEDFTKLEVDWVRI